MKWYKGKRVLITGGAGFIGSALAQKLSAYGAIVSVTTRGKNPWRLSGNKQIRILTVDLTNKEKTLRVLKKVSPEIVFNVAAHTAHDQNLDHFDKSIAGTFGITKHVVDAALSVGVRKFVHFGTIEEYIGGKAPYLESQHEAPISPYSLGKTLATQLVLFMGRMTTMDTCVIRPAATFGPMQDFKMIVPNFIRAGLEQNNFSMNKGEQQRDFLYIDDLIEGVLLAGKSAKVRGEIINLGSGKSTQVKSLVTEINKLMGNPITVSFGSQPYRPHDTMLTLLDIKKARTLLGWSPQYALRDSLKKTIAWYRTHYKTDTQSFI